MHTSLFLEQPEDIEEEFYVSRRSPRSVVELMDEYSTCSSGDTDSEDESETGSESEYRLSNTISLNIYRTELDYVDSDKVDGYYIGKADVRNSNMMIDITILPKTFFANKFEDVELYLDHYSVKNYMITSGRIPYYYLTNCFHIMKVTISPTTGEYLVVLKTCWLKIFQRLYRKRYLNNIMNH